MRGKKLKSALAALAVIVAFSGVSFNSYAVEPSENIVEEVTFEAHSTTTVVEDNIISDYPEITGFTNTATGTKVSWSAYDGAAKYRLFYWNGTMWKTVGTTANLNLTHDGLNNETTYRYTVRAIDSDGNNISSYNYDGYENTFLAPPVISSLSNTANGVQVKWNKSDYAENYRIYRSVQNGSWVKVGETSDTCFTDTKVDSGKKYTYTVRMVKADGSSFMSYYNNGKSITYVKAPKISKIENTATGAKISWSKCAGASKYRVYYLDSNNTWKGLGNTTSTSYIHDKLKTGTTYTYTVRCLDSKGNFVSGYDKTGVSNMFITTPTISSLTNINGGVQVKWGKLSGADSYRIYRKTKNSGWSYIGDSDSTTYVDKTASSGTNYTYTVRCLNSDGKLVSYYNSGKSITYVKAPKISKIENTATGAKISWSKCAGASKYRVYYLDSNNTWKGLGNTTSTSYTHDKLKTGTTYTYTVRCLDSKGNTVSGYNKTGTSNLFLAPPAISSVSKASGGNLVEWKNVEGASGYRLYRKTPSSSWHWISDITDGSASYVDSESSDRVCTYTLRLLDSNGNLISSYISDTKYYKNGVLCNGNVKDGNSSYFFDKGKLKSGYQTIDGKTYYYNSNGVIQKNCIVGSKSEGYKYASPSGVIIKSDEIQAAVDFVVAHGGSGTSAQKLRTCYNYLKNTFVYKRDYTVPSTNANFRNRALSVFNSKSGNCYAYGTAFACIARVLGYESRAITGQIAAISGGTTNHGWTEVYVNGQWLVCDVNMQWEIPSLNFYQVTYASYPVKPFYSQAKYKITFDGYNINWTKN